MDFMGNNDGSVITSFLGLLLVMTSPCSNHLDVMVERKKTAVYDIRNGKGFNVLSLKNGENERLITGASVI